MSGEEWEVRKIIILFVKLCMSESTKFRRQAPEMPRNGVIKMGETISVFEFAKKLGVPTANVLKTAWVAGEVGITLNSLLNADQATLLASKFNFKIEQSAKE